VFIVKKLFGNELKSQKRKTHKGFGAVPGLNNALPCVSTNSQRKNAIAEMQLQYPGMDWSEQGRNKRVRQRRELPEKIQRVEFKLKSLEAQLQELKAYEGGPFKFVTIVEEEEEEDYVNIITRG